jgi:4-amino-4-deoxy-L-arabinose transferase-like glycosyltransferase
MISWIGVFVLALAVRLYLFANYYTINNDGVVYLEAARRFWEGDWLQGLASFYPPAYPTMTALVYPVVGDWELAGQLWPFALGVLALFPLYGLLRRIYSARVAMAALYFYALSPYAARLSLEVRTEVPYLFFSVLALYFLQRALDERARRDFFLAGASSGLAYLTRPEGIGLVAVGAIYLFYRERSRAGWKNCFASIAVLVLGFLLLAAPYIAYLRWDTGSWAISRKAGLAFSMAMARQGVDLGESAPDSSQIRMIDFIAAHPLVYLKKVFTDSFRALGFYFEALHYSYLPFLLAGWLLFFRGRFWEKSDFLFLMLVLFYLATFALIHVTRRYGVPLVPFSLGWIACGYLLLADRIGDLVGARWRRYWVGALVVLFVAGTLPKTLQAIGWDKFYLREGGAYLKAKNGVAIGTNNARVAFYAAGENRVHLVDGASLPALLDKGLDYAALDDTGLRQAGWALKERGWQVEKEFSHQGKERLVIFRKGGEAG